MTGQHGTWIRQKERKILRLMAGAVLMLAAVWTLGGCGDGIPASAASGEAQASPMPLLYADQFSVDCYPDGSAVISVKESGRYLVLPEGGQVPEAFADAEDVTVIRRPLKNIYLAATSAMDLFAALDCVDQITLSGTDADGWYVEAAKEAMEEGRMVYAGKYNAPDYERILSPLLRYRIFPLYATLSRRWSGLHGFRLRRMSR